MKKKVVIVNYGVGNYASIIGTLTKLDCEVKVSNLEKELNNSDLIILPGVGTFPAAVKKLKKFKLIKVLRRLSKHKQILGICLGMHLLTESSNEIKYTEGLKLIPGKIESLKTNEHNIGWCSNKNIKKKSEFNFLNNKFFYFQHKFNYIGPKRFKISEIKEIKNLVSIIQNKKVLGVQFHPEKSQGAGTEFFKFLLQLI